MSIPTKSCNNGPTNSIKMLPFLSTTTEIKQLGHETTYSQHKHSPVTSQIVQSVPEIKKIAKRLPFPKMTYIAYLFAATLLPLLNLLILFTQSYNLSWQDNFASIERRNFIFYYIGISYYAASIIIFIFCSAITTLSLKSIISLYVLVDSNQICVIASNICYISLHLIYLCRDLAGNDYNIQSIDIIYLTLFTLNNFAFLGYFRISLLHYKWTVAETLTFKILVFTSSLSYFAYGILIIIGKDNLSTLLKKANNIVQSFIQSTDFGNLTAQVQTQLLQQMSNLSGNITIIQNLINLFVFTSFANICQVLSRLNDFDRSSDLQPNYQIDDEQQNDHEPKMEDLKKEFNLKFDNLHSEIKQIQILKNTFQMMTGNLNSIGSAAPLPQRQQPKQLTSIDSK